MVLLPASYRRLSTDVLEIRFCKILSLLLNSGISLPVSIKLLLLEVLIKNDCKSNAFSEAIVRGSDITKAAALASPLLVH